MQQLYQEVLELLTDRSAKKTFDIEMMSEQEKEAFVKNVIFYDRVTYAQRLSEHGYQLINKCKSARALTIPLSDTSFTNYHLLRILKVIQTPFYVHQTQGYMRWHKENYKIIFFNLPEKLHMIGIMQMNIELFIETLEDYYSSK